MKRRILSILLLAALVIGLLPQGTLSVNAYSDTDIAYPVKGGNLYFDKASGTITDCDNSVTGADIPAQIDGVAVTGIGSNAFKDCGKLISVTLPKSVTSIGDNAFSGCTYLSSTCDGVQGVIIPANVTSIDSLAFFGCECLQSVYFEGDAPEIGENVFTIKDPDSLWVDDIYVEYINIPGLTLYYIDGCTGWSFETWNGYHTMLWSGDPMNPEYPPLEPTEPTEPSESEGFTAYPVEGGNLYFYSADGTIVDCDETVTYADVPAEIDGIAVTGIGSSAFEYCISLTGVTIPESVTSIDSYAFEGCESLQSACFLGDAPALGTDVFCMKEFVFDSGFGVDTETIVIPGLTLYYIDGKADWTTPTWNGYPTATWDGVNVPEPADEIAYPVEGGNLYFRKSTGEIFDCDTTVTNADIPEKIVGVAVTSIGNSAFYYCTDLTSVTIPSSVTSIGDSAFDSCSSLISIYIPDSVTSIGDWAFWGCSSLTTVTIPNSVTSIGRYAFSSCRSLMTITIPDGITQIADSVFSDCSSLMSIEIPDSVTRIGAGAFKNCSSLTSVTIPEGVTSIFDYTFEGCSSLTTVTIPSKVMNIGKRAFFLSGLTSVTLPKWVESVGNKAFSNCDGLTEINVAEGNSVYSSENGVMFNKAKTTLLAYPAGKTEAEYCIPDTVTSIGDSAFFGCNNMKSITLSDRIVKVDSSAFGECDGLLDITVCNLECEIAVGNTLGLPDLAYVHGYAGSTAESFANDYGYYFVDIENPVPQQMSGNCGDAVTWQYDRESRTLTISGSGAMDDYSEYQNEQSVIPPWCHVKMTSNGVKWVKRKFYIQSLVVEPGVTYLGSYAFSNCMYLENVTISETVTCIGEAAFLGCNGLPAVTIPFGVTEIGKDAFAACWILSEVMLSDSVTSIGNGAFQDCVNLTEVTLSTGLTSIGANAFDDDINLKNITIPASVTSIGDHAFFQCTHLKAVYFMGDAPKLGWDVFKEYSSPVDANIRGLTLYYQEGRTGWTSPTWNDYPTAIWEHPHSYADAVTAPTCTEKGYTTHTCECGDSYTDTYVDAIGHDFGAWTQTKAPTCTEKGEEKRTCSRCDAFETREIAAHGHTEVVDAAVPATCTEAGKTEGKHCSVCGTVLIAQETVEALGHDYGDWTQMKAPTCTEKGEEKRVCSRCDAFETRELDVTDHTEVIDPAVAATCAEVGKTEGKHCSVCGTVLVAQETIDALGHDYGAWTQTKAPTCTEKGEEKRTCSRCDAFEVREIAAHGHTEVIDPAVPATCTEAGKTEGKHCSVCGTVLVAQETVPALGHSYKDGVCTVCGAKDPDAQPAAPVEFSDVSEKAWYYEAVEYAVENGLMNGVGGGKFDPEGTMTRAMLVTVLWRYEGEPAEGENSFTDVPNGTWYTEAVAWAAANGIVGGVGNGKFDPNGIITREQMATILFRYAQKRGFDTSKRGDLSVFPDSGKVSSWAKDAMRWAVAEQIINGSDGYLLPQGNATRAQVAALLMRFINKIETAAKPVEPPVDPKHVVTAGTRKLYIGMSLEDLSEYAGAPEETLPTTAGYTWYVYGTKDYTDYVMAGVYENKVVAICASGADFSYRGCTANGSVAEAEEGDTYHITMLVDKNDNSTVYGILLTDDQFRVQYAATKEALAGESRVAFHMANAFRVLHGVGILTWCDKAATAARLHSEDMATQNYVSHTSADGRLFYMRLRENGVLYNTCAENLCAGYYSGVGAHNAWVNSALHRANLLNASMDRCGVGFAYELNSDYRYYAVSDYYQAR